MSVTYQTLNISSGGGNENLLINPRGKINQANESDGVLSAGQYFCDGWKAGAAGAEVYRDADGFRLISGSILQLVPNSLDAGRKIMGGMDVIQGSPVIRINGGTDSELSNDQAYIKFEVTGNNSKFTRCILAESETLPIYQQSPDEQAPCLRFYTRINSVVIAKSTNSHSFNGGAYSISLSEPMNKPPAATAIHKQGKPEVARIDVSGNEAINVAVPSASWAVGDYSVSDIILDARP